jgi:enoyl-CoA hydratase/carnithine racemase
MLAVDIESPSISIMASHWSGKKEGKMPSSVLVERRGRVGIISLNRPERHNAMTDEMTHLMRSGLAELLADPQIRSLVIRGEGKSFCSGRDTTVLGTRTHDESHFTFLRRGQEVRLSMYDSPKPIIAALRGYAIGGGAEIALACDIRIATADLQLALPEINFGLVTDTGGSQALTAIAGPSRAKYMILTGRKVDAHTLLSWGAIDFIVEDDKLEEMALDIAEDIAAKAPIAVAMGKQLVELVYGSTIRSGIRQELIAQVALFATEDYREAASARREKRKPDFKGR